MAAPTASLHDPPLRLVLDTNVWLDLLLFMDPRCERLRGRLQSGALALTNAACREEWQRVLGYPELRLTLADRERLQARFDAVAMICDSAVRPLPWPQLPRCRDQDDQKFLQLACAGHADVLLTRDDALLVLGARTQRAGLFRICRPETDWAGCADQSSPAGSGSPSAL